jgi:transposase InsO family protein
MRVSASAYYAWRVRGRLGPSVRQQRDAEVLAEIKQVHAAHPECGSPRVTAELARRSKPCNHKKVVTTMAAHGIVARRHRRRRGLTKPDASAPAIGDLVARLFDPDDIDHTWAGPASGHGSCSCP